MSSRIDALDKATGRTVYAGDVDLSGMRHAALVRSVVPHARIVSIDASEALAVPGVVGVYTAEDLGAPLFGRNVRDVPVLAVDRVRFVGDRVAAVVADTRVHAEEAARLVLVDYEELPAVFDPAEAVRPGAPLVHDAPWEYEKAAVGPDTEPNLQTTLIEGSVAETERRLAGSAHVVDRTYATPAGHQGYIEPQAFVAHAKPDGTVDVWVTDKTPYRARDEIAAHLGLDRSDVAIQPVAIGGDFGGKGTSPDVILVATLSRLCGAPVRLVLRYWEDLSATNPRHAATMRVRVGCDRDGALTALHVDALVDGGAYAGFKPRPHAGLHGLEEVGSSYRIGSASIVARIAYTNSVPRGHMRAPGSPQTMFAVESALDELAEMVGLDPAELRLRNVLRSGDVSPQHVRWAEARGEEVLRAALDAAGTVPPVPPGWLHGMGLAMGDRGTTGVVGTSMRLVDEGDERIRVELPIPEQGAGMHTVASEALARGLGIPREWIRVRQVATAELPIDRGAGGSRVTVGLSHVIGEAIDAWKNRGEEGVVTVEVGTSSAPEVTSFCVQVAHVAVDPTTGEYRVLEIVTAMDVAEIINEAAHQMQIDGGTMMGFGFACLEDLRVEEGQVWAGNLGEFKLPSIRDAPRLRTILVTGSQGVGAAAAVKAVGESTNVAVAPAIANAIARATGVRIRRLPIRAEDIHAVLTADLATAGTRAAGDR